jgi:hypothetical protein
VCRYDQTSSLDQVGGQLVIEAIHDKDGGIFTCLTDTAVSKQRAKGRRCVMTAARWAELSFAIVGLIATTTPATAQDMPLRAYWLSSSSIPKTLR